MVYQRVKKIRGVYLMLLHQQHRVKNQLSVFCYNNNKESLVKKREIIKALV